MIDFSTLQGLTIPEGVVTQIADASGRVLWAVSGGNVVLQVEKVTSDVYAGETTYTGEQFILLDIYPKTNGTVKVTYGGFTKTITDTSGAEEPNAQQVFFGTFGGVSDSVTTPTSGKLDIEGDCYAFGCSLYQTGAKSVSSPCACVKSVDSFGNTSIIPDNAFGSALNAGCPLETVVIPDTIYSIGNSAFFNCRSLQTVTIGKGVKIIGNVAFNSLSESALKTVIMLGTTPPELVPGVTETVTEYNNFGSISATWLVLEEIIVPKGCGNAYKTAEGWTTYADYIVEAS